MDNLPFEQTPAEKFSLDAVIETFCGGDFVDDDDAYHNALIVAIISLSKAPAATRKLLGHLMAVSNAISHKEIVAAVNRATRHV